MTQRERIDYQIDRVQYERGNAQVGGDTDAIYAAALAQLEIARQIAVFNDYLPGALKRIGDLLPSQGI